MPHAALPGCRKQTGNPSKHIRTLLLCILLRCMSDFNEDCFQAGGLFVSVVLCWVLSPASILSSPSPWRWDGCLFFLCLK